MNRVCTGDESQIYPSPLKSVWKECAKHAAGEATDKPQGLPRSRLPRGFALRANLQANLANLPHLASLGPSGAVGSFIEHLKNEKPTNNHNMLIIGGLYHYSPCEG